MIIFSNKKLRKLFVPNQSNHYLFLNSEKGNSKKGPRRRPKKGSGKVELAVNNISDNHNLDMKYRGYENFTDLIDYADKKEAQIDSYQEKRALQGPGPINMGESL